MRKFRGLGVGLSVGLAAAIVVATPAAAFSVIRDEGTHGDFGAHDSHDGPGAKCGYSAKDSTGTAHLRWIRVKPVQAGPSAGMSSQKISWTVLIERPHPGSSSWDVVARSATQTKTANGSTPPAFTAITAYYKGHAGEQLRAVSVLRWLKNGHMTGKVKLWMEWYSVKWTVGDPAFIYEWSCDGAAD